MIQAESTMEHTARRSQSWYWLTLVPLVVGASLALLRYAGWAAVYSGNYDRPSQAVAAQGSGPKANLYWWVLAVLSLTATIAATILIPPFKSETLPVGLKAVILFVLAVVVVAASILIVTYGLLAVGHNLR
jgi:magnesium-transporting ATPase (P-type)